MRRRDLLKGAVLLPALARGDVRLTQGRASDFSPGGRP